MEETFIQSTEPEGEQATAGLPEYDHHAAHRDCRLPRHGDTLHDHHRPPHNTLQVRGAGGHRRFSLG